MKLFRVDFKFVRMWEPETAFVFANTAQDVLSNHEVISLMERYSCFDAFVTEVPIVPGLIAVEFSN